MKNFYAAMLSAILLLSTFGRAQQSVATATNAQVPPLIQFSNVVSDLNGKPLTGMVGVTFYLYKDQQGGSPLWMETQNVQPDKTGHYTVLLGSTTSQGLPASIFVSGEAHWLGVQALGQEEQARVLLVSAPYALKAGDAETVGGLPASAFVLAVPASPNTPNNGSSAGTPPAGTTAGVVGSGTADFIPLWTANSILGNSVLFQSGSGGTATVGINTTTPAATLDVNGNVISRGPLQLPSTGTANASAGFNSQPFSLQGSSFNSGTQKAIGPLFQWQTEPSGNNTSTPAGTLNLLYGSGSGSPSETGLNIASNGKITFATGQTFPGTGAGTVTSVGSGLGLKGGPINTSGTLTIDTTVVPQLGAANTFTGNQTVNGTFTANASGSTAGVTGNGVTYGVYGSASTTNGTGVFGFGADGVLGLSSSPTGSGVFGESNASTGSAAGVSGSASSATGYGVVGVQGSAILSTTIPAGVYGSSSANAGYGVWGVTTGSLSTGVEGDSPFTGVRGTSAGFGVLGVGNGTAGNTEGVAGTTPVPNGYGVVGSNNSSSGNAAGVLGQTQSPAGYGVQGTSSYIGVYGTGSEGVVGITSSTANGSAGVMGSTTSGSGANYAVWGLGESPAGYGVYGENFVSSGNTAGVYGQTASLNGYGVEGQGPEVGVYGQSTSESALGHEFLVGTGLWGDGGTYGYGVLGTTDAGSAGAFFNNAPAPTPALYAENDTPVGGGQVFQAQMPNVLNTTVIIGDPECGPNFMALQLGALFEFNTMSGCNNYTLMGDINGNTYLNAGAGGSVSLRVNNGDGVMNITSGNVTVNGNFSVTGVKHFRIDHPLDPANKYLFHASIESSEVLNLYSGNVVLDGSGEAVVHLPDWFEVINKDFRYQLTPIGAPGRDLYVAEEVSGGHFKIAGGKPGGKVSWQVSGVRNDAWEKAHPMQVEADKGTDRGHYLTPELYGAPETAAIGYMVPARGSEKLVHQRPTFPQRRNAAPSQEGAPLNLPMPHMPAPPKALVLPHAAALGSKPMVNQK